MPARWATFAVTRATPEVSRLADDIRARRLPNCRYLPLLLIPRGEIGEAPPTGCAPGPFVDDSVVEFASSIDGLLRILDTAERTLAVQGNRWACGGSPTLLRVVPPLVLRVWGHAARGRLSSRLGHPAALNLSLAMHPRVPWATLHPIRVATYAASKIVPVLAAAGNLGNELDSEQMSQMALLPWTIGVTATEDAAGTRLLGSASKDVIGQSGSLLAAFGENPFLSGSFGTSFATARVTRQAVALSSFASRLADADAIVQGILLLASPLPISCYVDRYNVDHTVTGRPSHAELPYLSPNYIDFDALEAVHHVLRSAGALWRAAPTPALTTRLLFAAARLTTCCGPETNVAGFLDDDAAEQFIRSFDGAQFADFFCDTPQLLTNGDRTRLKRHLLVADGLAGNLVREAHTNEIRLDAGMKTGWLQSSTPFPVPDPYPEDDPTVREIRAAKSWPDPSLLPP